MQPGVPGTQPGVAYQEHLAAYHVGVMEFGHKQIPSYITPVMVMSEIFCLLFTAEVSSSSVSDTDPVSDSEPLPDFFRGLFFVCGSELWQSNTSIVA